MVKQVILYVIITICFFLYGCNASSNAGSEEQFLEDNTGYSSESVQIECVMVNDHLFQYSDEGWLTNIPEGYEKIGSVLQVDNSEYPTENFYAGRLSIGDEIYVDSNSGEMKDIYVRYQDGTCAKFVPATIVP